MHSSTYNSHTYTYGDIINLLICMQRQCTDALNTFSSLYFALLLFLSTLKRINVLFVKTVITVMRTGKCTYFFSIKESKLTYLWCRPIFAPSLFILTYICYIQIRFISRTTANVVWFSLHVRLQFILAIKSAKATIEVRTHILHYHFLFWTL